MATSLPLPNVCKSYRHIKVKINFQSVLSVRQRRHGCRLASYLTDIQHVRVAEQCYGNINLLILSLVSCRWGLKKTKTNINMMLNRFAVDSNALAGQNCIWYNPDFIVVAKESEINRK